MKNIRTTISYLVAVYLLPLLGHIEYIWHWKNVVLLLTCIVMIGWAQPQVFFKDNLKKTDSDKGTMLLISLFGYIAAVAPVIEWAYFKTETGFTIWTGMGLALIVGGLCFRIWSLQVLGRFFTGAVQQVEGHQLVTDGPYRWLRHPSYLGSWVTFLGCAVFLDAWVGFVVAFSFMLIAYYFRIKAEEATLHEIFGEQYRAYRDRTWRMVPFVW